jgi:ribosomal protein S9
MSEGGIGSIVSKAQEFVTALASAPQPEETRFVRNARPFAIYLGMVALTAMGILAVYLKDIGSSLAVVAAIGGVLQQFGAQRSADARAKIAAATEDKKTITGAATADKQIAAGGQP